MRILNWSIVLAGLSGVALIDYATGVEVHVVTLYFVPLALAATRLGMRPALAVAVGSGILWTLVQFAIGVRHETWAIWLINFGTQTLAFAVVAFLIARWSESAIHEPQREQTELRDATRHRQAFVERAAKSLESCRDVGAAASTSARGPERRRRS